MRSAMSLGAREYLVKPFTVDELNMAVHRVSKIVRDNRKRSAHTDRLREQRTAYVTRQVHRDALFIYSSFGVENPALTRSHGIGTATNKLIPYQVEPVVAGFRSQEFTLRLSKLSGQGGAA